MEKYIGRNYIEAEPMTMGEAYEQQLIKAGRAPNESEKNVAGYHIKHDDDSENWLPADMFEKAYERVETPYDMMEVEENDLYNRSAAIYNILMGEKYSELDETEKALLTAQYYAMSEYLEILYTRSTKMENPDGGCSGLKFSSIIALLYNGFTVRRQSWADKNLCIIKQVPACIASDVIPKMQSLPQSAKDIILKGTGYINYLHQCLIYNRNTGVADSWVPSMSDIFSSDWELVDPNDGSVKTNR